MARAHHRVDLYAVIVAPFDEGAVREALQSPLFADANVRVEVAPSRRFYANGQFHARCPRCGQGVVEAFVRAVAHRRSQESDGETGLPSTVVCRCGWAGVLDEVLVEPPAAWGYGAVVFPDTASVDLDVRWRAALEAAAGPLVVVLRRL